MVPVLQTRRAQVLLLCVTVAGTVIVGVALRRFRSSPNAPDGSAVCPPTPTAGLFSGTRMHTVTTPDEFRKVLSAPRAMLFVDVDWSVGAVSSAQVVRDVVVQCEREPVEFARLDLTKQEGAIWDAVGNWLQTQKIPDHLMTNGNGELIWTCRGQVTDYQPWAAGSRTQDLIERTKATRWQEPPRKVRR
jgi:hypothetical protein